MLSKILKKSDCATCRFCCSFRRQSLWETPIFDAKTKNSLEKKFPNAKFRSVGKSSFTIDLLNLYKTDDEKEEVPCPFLDLKSGCVLCEQEKPFDCKIWPLRVMKTLDLEKKFIVLTPTCPSINKIPFLNLENFVKSELAQKIWDYANEHPDIVKDLQKDFPIIC